jgi:hypothetical protein
MTTNHDAVAALPISGSANKTLLRNLVVARMPYSLADADDSRNLIAIDPATGAIPMDLLFLGRDFHYDATDTTTAHDGTSCLVSADGLRYKLAAGTDVFAYSVLNNTTSAPPASPTIGDAYLVAAGATGAWAGKSNYIATFTRRGWEFINFGVGRFIYVGAIDTYYHKNTGGAWVVGLGNQIFAANSVPLSAAINFGRRVIVENQPQRRRLHPRLQERRISSALPRPAHGQETTEKSQFARSQGRFRSIRRRRDGWLTIKLPAPTSSMSVQAGSRHSMSSRESARLPIMSRQPTTIAS